jgi:uncharacterized iron-regulated protein
MSEKEKTTRQLLARYEKLTVQLGKIGLVLQGTITERNMVRAVRRLPSKKKAYGPYYQWTFKKSSKTVTVNLTAVQAKSYQKAINNNRKMENIIKEMREISVLLCESTTTPVKKRKLKNKPIRA